MLIYVNVQGNDDQKVDRSPNGIKRRYVSEKAKFKDLTTDRHL